jgi:hypothetical protein
VTVKGAECGLELTNIKKGICWYCSIFKILISGEEYISADEILPNLGNWFIDICFGKT